MLGWEAKMDQDDIIVWEILVTQYFPPLIHKVLKSVANYINAVLLKAQHGSLLLRMTFLFLTDVFILINTSRYKGDAECLHFICNVKILFVSRICVSRIQK